MDKENKFFMACGRIIVKAQGYWFTSGGEKGSFGYYPHLKMTRNGRQLPIYPDTQIKGDLRMAAKWLCAIECGSNPLVDRVFGVGGNKDGSTNASLLFVSDLEITDEAKWKDVLFQVKARTEIDDETRTTKNNMLVNLEVAYLDSMTLAADIYLGYFSSEAELDKAKGLIEDSLRFLSGFGAFRSRGYGRWKESSIEWKNAADEKTTGLSDDAGTFILSLTPLVNFRNKQVDYGTTQKLDSRPYISAEQVRAWFVKAYNMRFNEWPTPVEMSGITFSSFYPSLKSENTIELGYPAAMTTLKNECGRIKDVWGLKEDEMRAEDKEFVEAGNQQENFFATKTKPLSPSSYVTNSGTPKVISYTVEKRLRNSTKDNFLTKEIGGLFLQELIRRGTVFAGTVDLPDASSDFGRKARYVMNNLRPVINGCIFDCAAHSGIDQSMPHKEAFLAVSPLLFDAALANYRTCEYKKDDGGRFVLDNANMITLSTERRYNRQLNRPRRQRIVIAQGSVVLDPVGGTVPWQGFGEDCIDTAKSPACTQLHADKSKAKVPHKEHRLAYMQDLLKDLTRTQAGIFRELLNEKRAMNEILAVVEDRIAKYEAKDKKGLQALYKEIRVALEQDNSGVGMRKFINHVLDRLGEQWWERLSKGGSHE